MRGKYANKMVHAQACQGRICSSRNDSIFPDVNCNFWCLGHGLDCMRRRRLNLSWRSGYERDVRGKLNCSCVIDEARALPWKDIKSTLTLTRTIGSSVFTQLFDTEKIIHIWAKLQNQRCSVGAWKDSLVKTNFKPRWSPCVSLVITSYRNDWKINRKHAWFEGQNDTRWSGKCYLIGGSQVYRLRT